MSPPAARARPVPGPQAGVDRLRGVWGAKIAGAREQAVSALLILVVVSGAHLARLGTPAARAATAAAILGVVVLQIVLALARRRERRSTRRTLRRVLFATDRSLGEKALRALDLVERTEEDDTVGSPALARLHLTRVVERATTASVASAASRHALRLRGVAIACLSLAVVAVGSGPVEVVEGLDVLFARAGRAPVRLPWLRYAKVSAVPPSYTREGERSLVLGMRVTLPKGTVLTVRGVPSPPGRTLVFGDGARDEPFSSDGAGGVVARYQVKESGTLHVSARFGDVRIEDEESLEVVVVQDAPPEVEVEDTPRSVRLVDGERIDVRWVASDDHGLRQVDLVLRSGAREERKVLARFDGETRLERGGHVLMPRDPFFRRAFVPVEVTVEAKDNDPLDGPKWRASRAIVVVPPEVGQGEASRHAALRSLRDEAVGLLAERLREPAAPPGALSARAAALRANLGRVQAATYAGVTVPEGFAAFVQGLLDKVSARAGRSSREPPAAPAEDLVLGLDVALGSLGNQDAAEVSKRLGDVVEEVALAARMAREGERGEGEQAGEELARLDAALAAASRGIVHLSELGALGRDLGGVATADAGRITRARKADDLVHTELAALHLAARLRRPSPSFGSSGGRSRGGGGVESGRSGGQGEGALPPPSGAADSFDRAAREISELTREHQGVLRGVEDLLREASRPEDAEQESDAARRHAEALREAASALPLPGQEFGTPRAAAALAREHAQAAAQSLSNHSFEEAVSSAESALQALREAERRIDLADPVREGFGKVKRALTEASDFARQALSRERAARDARARERLAQAGDVESELSARAERLSREKGGDDGALPEVMTERLGRASALMQEAARRLSEGKGEDALALQREAQRLLEQSRSGRTGEDRAESTSETGERESASRDDHSGRRGDQVALGGDVPGPDPAARAEEFRKRVLQGLGREKSERLAPAVKRYAEGLLR